MAPFMNKLALELNRAFSADGFLDIIPGAAAPGWR